MSLKVSVSGIRGVVGVGLDAESVTRWAAAFGNWLPDGPVVVARDSRPSGPMFVAAVEAALRSTGHDVVDAGLLSTPGTEMLVQESDAVGGVIVTASHNPVEWNALKLLRGDGLFLDAQQVEQVVALHDAPRRAHRSALELGGRSERDDGDDFHVRKILALPYVDLERVRARGLHVVVDAVEGAGGHVVPELLRRMGVRVTEQYCDRSGRFPRDPEPRPDHLHELVEAVARTGADFGLAVDPDVDRLALVDRGGVPLSEELTLAIAADHVLARTPGPVVVNLSTTLAIDHVARRHGVAAHRAAVGEANVVARMVELGAVVGGEGNGGVILPALHAGRDAVLGAALVVSAVAEHGSLEACRRRLPAAAMAKDKVELVPAVDRPERWRSAAESLGPGGAFDLTDGIRYDLGDRWIHLRRSNTEPVLRIIAEADSEAAARAMIATVRAALGV